MKCEIAARKLIKLANKNENIESTIRNKLIEVKKRKSENKETINTILSQFMDLIQSNYLMEIN